MVTWKLLMTNRVKILEGELVSLVVPEKEDIQLWYQGVNDIETQLYLWSLARITSLAAEEEFFPLLQKIVPRESLRSMQIRIKKISEMYLSWRFTKWIEMQSFEFQFLIKTIDQKVMEQRHYHCFWNMLLRSLDSIR